MATTYYVQPFTSTTVNPNKARHGEQGEGYDEVYVIDVNNNIFCYTRPCPGLASTLQARRAEAQALTAAIVAQLNAQ